MAVASGRWCSDRYPGMQGDTRGGWGGWGGGEKKTLDRLLHESAVE